MYKRLGLWAIILFLFTQCQNGGLRSSFFGGSSIEPMFEKVIDIKQNLVFRFPKPMVKPGQIGEWDTTQFLGFQPRVVGQFKWTSVDELIFSPDASFAFATSYTASIAKPLVQLAPELAGNDPIRFETQQLEIENIESQWTKESNGLVYLRFRISLNQSVLPDELVQGLQLELEGKKVDFELEDHIPGNSFSVKINTLEFTNKNKVLGLKATLNPSKLTGILKNWLKKPTEFSVEIQPVNQLLIYGLDIRYSESGTNLILRLSQSISDSAFQSFIKIPGIEHITSRIHSQGLEINGNFTSKAALELLVLKGIKGSIGGVLKSDKTIGFRIGGDEPLVKFANKKALYLPKEGNHLVGIHLESVPEIAVSVYQVFPNNILFNFQNSGGYEGDYYSEYQDDFGTLVYSRNFRSQHLKKEGNQHLVPLDFEGFSGQKGIFIVRISDAEKRYVGDKKIISITDIGLLVKSTPNQIWVQAQSISTTQPIEKAKITVIGKNNQPLFTAETDGQGRVEIPLAKMLSLGTQPQLIVCETSKDFTYLLFDQTRLETSRFPVDGIPYSASGWQAEVFGPRNLYKPGESIDLQILLRDKHLAAVPEIPLMAKVLSPSGKMVQVLKTTTGKFGQGLLNFTIPAYLSTGTYQVEIYGGAKELLTTHSLHIESFDPLPLEITATQSPAILPFGKDWQIGITVDNMFGLPAGERPVDVQLSWENAEFTPTGFEDYNFNLNYVDNAQKLLLATGTTDSKGMAKLDLPASQIPANQGLLKVKARIQVFDESQIPVYKTVSSQMRTQPGLLGFKILNNRLFFRRLNKIELVSLNETGKPVNAKAWAEIYTKTYSSVMEAAPEEPSGYRYVSREVVKLVKKEVVELVDGKGRVNFFPETEGNYEIKIKANESADRYLTFDSYVYAGENEGPVEEEANTEGNIEISCNQKMLKPGEEAQLHFQTPFDGKLTVTLEQDRVLKTYTVETKNNSAVLLLPINSDMAPNIYVSSTLTRAITKESGQNPLTTAYGYASIPVQLSDKELKTTLNIPGKSLSGVKLPIRIELSSGKESGLAVAVVDEGILQVTNYKIPDPFQYFHRKKALNVETFSTFGKIFKSLTAGRSGIGGDGLYMKMAANEMDAKQLVSTFLTTEKPGKDPKGNLQLLAGSKSRTYQAMVDIPAGFAGKIRVMVVTYNNQQVGYNEKVVTVADPITIKTSLPDYLFPGDRFEGTASFFNTGSQSITFQPVLNATSIVSTQKNWPATITLKPGQVNRLGFSLNGNMEGMANVSVESKVGNQRYLLAKSFSIKPPAWIVRHQIAGELKPKESVNLLRPEFLSNKGLQAKLEFNKNPFLSLTPAVKNLLQYPYGCLEQTISAAFPLLYLPDEWLEDIGNQLTIEPNQKWKKNLFVADAIQKVSNLQQYGGGFAYWPGNGWTHDYYSIYATQFLWEARQAGFAVDPTVLKNAIENVFQISKENLMWVYSGNGSDGKRLYINYLAPRIPYALYVSSLVGKPNRQALIQWKAQPERLDQEGRYMLACALLLAGDGEAFDKILPSKWTQTLQTEGPVKKKSNSYSIDNQSLEIVKSTTQEEAFVLSALTTAWPTNPAVNFLAARLRNKIALQSELLSTQEEGMGLVALAKLMKTNIVKGTSNVAQLGSQILLDGKEGKVRLSAWNEPLVLKNNNGSGSFYYWLDAQGQSSTGKIPEKDAGLEVRKTYYNALGKLIDPTSFKINDLVVVRLSLTSKIGVTIPQIALVDVIPSCLRIENKRIGQSSDFKTITPASEPVYVDIRRDRVNIFCDATPSEQSFYYSARVIAKGNYFWGPTEAQAMYQPSLFSRNGGKPIHISEQASGSMTKL